MSQVINSQGLFVMQIEVDVYNLLKMWVYAQLHPECTGSWKDVREQGNTYFSSRASDYSAMNCFLETDEGKVFVPAFRSIRLHHVVNDLRSIQLLDTDRIIPQGMTVTAFAGIYNLYVIVIIKIEKHPVRKRLLKAAARYKTAYRLIKGASF